MTIVPVYSGPQCPRCSAPLIAVDATTTGTIVCSRCHKPFEATAFTPPERKAVVTTEVMAAGPDGANACANHTLNAAVASCQRCGLFICGLCDMNVGSGSYCPGCFERVRAEGSLQSAARRYRDYATMARSFAIAGILLSLLFIGPPFGAMAMFYGIKARKQRRKEGRSVAGVTITFIVGLLEVLGGLALYGFLAYSMFKAASK